MLPSAGRRPHEISGKASNTCWESHLARPSNPTQNTFRIDSETASKIYARLYFKKSSDIHEVKKHVLARLLSSVTDDEAEFALGHLQARFGR